jgi:hypothetical protein
MKIIKMALLWLVASTAALGQTLPVNNLTVSGTSQFSGLATFTGGLTATGQITNADLATQAANTILANVGSTTASPTAFAMPSCSTSSSALTYTTNTGVTCNTSINAATLGGATFASPGPIGSTAASTGAFTTLSASSTVSGTGFTNYFASPPALGGTTPNSGAFTTLSATGTSTLAGVTATSMTNSGLTANSFVYSGTGGLMSSTAAPTNGQLLIGSTGVAPVKATLTGTTNQVNVANGAGSITLSLPQSIDSGSSPTFSGVTLSGLTANSFVYSGAGGALTATTAPTNGQILIGSTGAAPVKATITGTTNRVTVTNGAGTITLSGPQDLATTSSPTFSNLTLTNNITSYSGTTTAGNGIPVIVLAVHQTAQQANYSTTYAVPTGQGGMYRVGISYIETQAATTSSTLPQGSYTWTDSDSGTSVTATGGLTSGSNTVGATGQNTTMMYAKSGTNITLGTTGYASTGATPMQYSIRMQLEYLGP